MAPLEAHHGAILSSLLDLQRQGVFTDLEVHFQDGSVRVSRNLVAALSPVFGRMFLTEMAEEKERVVRFQDFTRGTWQCVLEYYYSTSKSVTVENVSDVLAFSHMYQLEALEAYCSQFLMTSCSVDNCFDVWSIAQQYGLEDVERRVKGVIAQDFSTVCKTDDFLSLGRRELVDLVENEVLVTTEEELCLALLEWMTTNEADEGTVVRMFGQLLLSRLPEECLRDQLVGHPLLSGIPSLRAAVQAEAKRRRESSALCKSWTVPRRRVPWKDLENVVVLGHNRREMCAYRWSLEAEEWETLPPSPFHIPDYFSSAQVKDVIVVTGGYHDSQATALLDLRRSTWSLGPELQQGRYSHCMAVVRDAAYVVGGWNDTRELSSIEEFTLASGEWTLAGSIPVATNHFAVAALKDKLVVVGVNNENSQNLVQTFDVVTRTAAVLDLRMPCPMFFIRAASHEDVACFLSSEGDLVQIHMPDDRARLAAYVRIPGFGDRFYFGLVFDGRSLTLYGGCSLTSVDHFDLQGNRIGGDGVQDLPSKFKVHGVVKVKADARGTGTRLVDGVGSPRVAE